MTIKQQGGIFGRNPTFNNVTVDGTLTVDQIVEKTGAAGITLDGVTLKDGNVVLADGKGIDFSATTGTGTSELFDDYEEGTWTPTQGTFGTWTSPTFDARYTKIGNVVSFSLRQTGGTIDPDGVKKAIGGLPYAVAVAASCSVSAGSGSWDLGNALIWTDETIGLGLDVGPQTALVIFGQYITG